MKNELTDLLEKGYQTELEFIAKLSDAEREAESTLEKWNAKDIIAHNSYWRQHHAENILSTLAGNAPAPTEDYDHANEEIYYRYREQPWEQVEALARISCERMQAALDALGDEGLQRAGFFPWHEGRPLWRSVVGNLYTHPIMHLSDWHLKNGNTARAAELYQEMTGPLTSLDDSPDWQGTLRYNVACSYSLLGDKGKAIEELREALKMNPALLEWSKQDPDFEPIRSEAGYKALYE